MNLDYCDKIRPQISPRDIIISSKQREHALVQYKQDVSTIRIGNIQEFIIYDTISGRNVIQKTV